MSDVLVTYHCKRCEVGMGGLGIADPVPICWLCDTRMLPGSVLRVLERKVHDADLRRTEWEGLMESMERLG
jgi:hypothetical protein